MHRICRDLLPRMKTWRRDFHRYPETGWTEFRTASLVARELAATGWDVLIGREVVSESDRMGLPDAAELDRCWHRAAEEGAPDRWLEKMRDGFTGVVGVLDCGPGPVVAMRFDMDALGVSESKDSTHRPCREGFASVHEAVMHACGHDAHTAVGLAVANVLAQYRRELCGKIKLVFQPAEEGVRGALAMVRAGVMDDVDYFIGHHVMTGLFCGQIIPGMEGWVATQKFDATFHGEPAHAGGSPEGGHNALLAGAAAVTNLYAIPRNSRGVTRINVGRFSAGSGRNVIPDRAHLVCEVRGADGELCDYMYDRACTVLRASAEMYGCSVQLRLMGSAPSGASSPGLVQCLEQLGASEMPWLAFVPAVPAGGSEDATYMMQAVQDRGGLATMVGIGAGFLPDDFQSEPSASEPLAAHTSTFDINEECMPIALELLCRAAQHLGQEATSASC